MPFCIPVISTKLTLDAWHLELAVGPFFATVLRTCVTQPAASKIGAKLFEELLLAGCLMCLRERLAQTV